MVPMEGIEPPTLALRKPCSTPELHRRMAALWLLGGHEQAGVKLLKGGRTVKRRFSYKKYRIMPIPSLVCRIAPACGQ